jgi:glycosyltransferase involved in cell wall biosynthesis
MNKKYSISIIIPCLNEEQNLEKALLDLNKEFYHYPYNWEVIIINDGSRDNTSLIAKKYCKTFSNFSIINNPITLGLSKSFYKGIRSAKNDYVVFFPGDNEISARSLRINSEKIGKADILLSYPENPQQRIFYRSLISKLFILIINLLLNKNIKYYNASNIYRRKDLNKLNLMSDSFAYQILIFAQLIKKGKTYSEYGFKLNYRSNRNTPISFCSLYNVILDLVMLIKIRISKNYEK